MAAFTLTYPLARDAWPQVIEHPEVIWGHGAPDLRAGTDFHGPGSHGTIEAVEPGRVEFAWAGVGWPQPGRFVIFVGTELTLDARALPDDVAPAARAHWERAMTVAADYLNSTNPPIDGPPSAVLFDADGVLQTPRPGWLEDFVALGGPTFVIDAFAAEVSTLTGAEDLRPKLAVLLESAPGTVDEVLDVWHDIVVDPDALALVDRVRDSGITVGLATNQQRTRGIHMRDVVGIDRHFDVPLYSYEVGHAKPSLDYFHHAVAVLGLPADQVAFVDDAPANVTAARTAGLRAVLHRWSTGADGLATDLRALGLIV